MRRVIIFIVGSVFVFTSLILAFFIYARIEAPKRERENAEFERQAKVCGAVVIDKTIHRSGTGNSMKTSYFIVCRLASDVDAKPFSLTIRQYRRFNAYSDGDRLEVYKLKNRYRIKTHPSHVAAIDDSFDHPVVGVGIVWSLSVVAMASFLWFRKREATV